MLKIFNNPEKDIFRVSNRSDFDKLLCYSQSRRFAKRLIVIEHGVKLTNADLQELILILKSNSKAVRKFTELAINDNPQITELPDLSAFKMKLLYMHRCSFSLPPNLNALSELEHLAIISCNLAVAPELIYNKNLKYVNFSDNLIKIAPDFSANINLEAVEIAKCALTTAPAVDFCRKLKKYNVRSNNIKFMPNLKNNHHLQSLDFSYNCLDSVTEIAAYDQLTNLHLNNNQIRLLPGLPASLKLLYIGFNLLEKAPNVVNCKSLWILSAPGNRLLYASDLSNCTKIEYVDFIGNHLTLMSKIYVMSSSPKNALIYFTVDTPGNWVGGIGVDNFAQDSKFLTKLFKSLPSKVSNDLYAQSDFALYQQRYFAGMLYVFHITAMHGIRDEGLFFKILEYYIVLPREWLNYNTRLLQKAFAHNLQALLSIDKYLAKNQVLDLKAQQQIIDPWATRVRAAVILQFKRNKSANNFLVDVPSVKEHQYNRITANRCVIS